MSHSLLRIMININYNENQDIFQSFSYCRYDYIMYSYIFLDSQNAEFVVLTNAQKSSNITIERDDVEIFLQIKNKTRPGTKRKRREVISSDKTSDIEGIVIDDDQIIKARDVIKNHDVLCNNEFKNEICEDLVTKLQAITNDYNEAKMTDNPLILNDVTKEIQPKQELFKTSTEVAKRMTQSTEIFDPQLAHSHIEFRDGYDYGNGNMNPLPHSHTPHLTDTCLLARLLKQNYPNIQGNLL